MMMSSYPEKDVAESFGLTLPDLRGLRHTDARIQEGPHWSRDGKRVVWTEDGLVLLTEIVKIKNSAPPAPPATERIAPQETLLVDRIVPNRAFVMVRRMNAAGDADGPLLRLRVKDNRNFMPGMRVANCRPVPGSPDLYHHEGRSPRFRGRW